MNLRCFEWIDLLKVLLRRSAITWAMETALQSDSKMENPSKFISLFTREYFSLLWVSWHKRRCLYLGIDHLSHMMFLIWEIIFVSLFSCVCVCVSAWIWMPTRVLNVVPLKKSLFYNCLGASELKQIWFKRFGAFYAWNAATSTFEFYKGEELKRKNEDNQVTIS